MILSQGNEKCNKKRAVDNRPYNENPPFPNVGADIIRPLGCSVQHVFNENAVAGCGVIDEDMGKAMIPTRFDGLSNTDSVESACVIQTKPI